MVKCLAERGNPVLAFFKEVGFSDSHAALILASQYYDMAFELPNVR